MRIPTPGSVLLRPTLLPGFQAVFVVRQLHDDYVITHDGRKIPRVQLAPHPDPDLLFVRG